MLIGGGAVGAAGLALSIAAGVNFGTLSKYGPTERSGPDSTQRALNITADVTVGVAVAALATGIVLLIADAASSKAPSEEAHAEATP
jgi:hypothetical protein